jgi:hypothetical protein
MVTKLEQILMNERRYVVVVEYVSVKKKKEILLMMKHLVFLLIEYSVVIKLLKRILVNI